MPHRRKPEKGSFGGHFDQLVKHFPENHPASADGDEDERAKVHRDVHDRLFDIACRASRQGDPPAN